MAEPEEIPLHYYRPENKSDRDKISYVTFLRFVDPNNLSNKKKITFPKYSHDEKSTPEDLFDMLDKFNSAMTKMSH